MLARIAIVILAAMFIPFVAFYLVLALALVAVAGICRAVCRALGLDKGGW